MNEHPPRLIVVDDEAEFRKFVARVATGAGFKVLEIGNPKALIDCVKSERPAVIVMDLNMPEADGIELLRDLAGSATQSHVLLASGMDDKVLATALRLGQERGLNMAGVVHKPVRARELRAALEPLLPSHLRITAETIAAGISGNQFLLHYQPRLDLRANRLTGVEALVRWQFPDNGRLMGPSEFIPIAEETGLITMLTLWIFENAISQCGRWHSEGLEIGVSVNLSAKDVVDEKLPDWLVNLCQRHKVPPPRVTVELTETAAMLDAVLMMDVLTRFRVKGFHLAIDDFGTGYSSLVQLQRLPFSEMKIDKSFVMSMASSRDSAVIVKTIIAMAQNLGLQAVAEGVERKEVLAQLRSDGCHFAQGYFLSRPVAADEIPPMLRKQ